MDFQTLNRGFVWNYVDIKLHREDALAPRAGACGNSPEKQGELLKGQEVGGQEVRGRDQQAEEQQTGGQRTCAVRAASRGGGQRTAERGEDPKEVREAATVPRGLSEGAGK